MPNIKTFQDILAWQKARKLTLEIYNATKSFPKSEEFSLVNQMRRSAYSIPCNLAEGFKRTTNKESLRFYNIAEASLEELKYQLILAKDLCYLDANLFDGLKAIADEVGKILNGWIKSQR